MRLPTISRSPACPTRRGSAARRARHACFPADATRNVVAKCEVGAPRTVHALHFRRSAALRETTMTWLASAFVKYPELAVFLVVGLGCWLGKFKIKGIGLGPVTCS